MKDLFEVLKETLNASSKGLGNTGTKNGATGLLGSAAVGGLLAALFGGSKVLRSTAKNVATVGGGAIAGAVAYKIFQKWVQNKNGNGQAQPVTTQGTTKGTSGVGFTDPRQKLTEEEGVISAGADDRDALLLIEAMIFAARADGHIDEE